MGRDEIEDLIRGVMILLRLYQRTIRKASNRIQNLITKIDKHQILDQEVKWELIRIKEILDLVGKDVLSGVF